MIVAERKPFAEIKEMVAGYKKLMIAGCGTCTTICWAGGEKEVSILASELKLAGSDLTIIEGTTERQCEKEMVLERLGEKVPEADAILSMACGAGVDMMASLFENKPVLPALNTTFLGAPQAAGLWTESCGACGDCMMQFTAGICPVVRCAKGIMNGPCAGMKKGGKCELDGQKDCAWAQIYARLEKQGRLDVMAKYYQPKNWRAVQRPGTIKAAKA